MINYTLIRSKKDIVFPMVVRLAISLVSRRISKLPETSNISDLNRKIEICAERCISICPCSMHRTANTAVLSVIWFPWMGV